jgi:gamma-glutamyltranspeptidase/glutathione hydrolase
MTTRDTSSSNRSLSACIAGELAQPALSRRDLLHRAGRLAGATALAGAASAADRAAGFAAGARGDGSALLPGRQLEPGASVQAVVSSHTLATDAGIEILAAGGTAADAAIAVAAALSVVEPWFSSALGGGTWALYFDAETGEVTSVDGVGPVGSNASREDYAARAGIDGIHQSVVPGAWDGWMLWLDRYGELDLGEVLAPAIRIAREGYPVSPEMAYWLGVEAEFLANDPDAARTYLAQGRIPGAGETVRQPEMANTFAALAQAYDGARGNSRAAGVQAARDYFYRGPLAAAIVAASDQGGGYLTLPDFERFAAEIVPPLAIDYRNGITVFENPPNSQGITMLLALNILKGFDFSGVAVFDPDAIHIQVEALKLAFADRHWYVGDPDRIDVPVAELLSDEYAARQRRRINVNRALNWPIAGGLADPSPSHTTTFHVVDRFGNAAAVTTSLGAQFRLIGETGIHINNRMRMISVEPGNANELTPGSKVRHTANPYLALRNGRPYILGGNTGVDTQPQGQLQQVMSVVEFGLNAQEAIDKPRFVSTAWPAGSYPWTVGNQLQLETGFPDSALQALIAKGHDVVVGEGIFGSANMIVVSADGSGAEVGAESRSPVSAGVAVPAA